MHAVAIDFETANEQRTSACSIGLSWIENGVVVGTEEHLIRPPDMRFNSFNTAIHGIRASDVENEPEFDEVWYRLRDRVEGRLLIAHNASFDISVLRHTLRHFGLTAPLCPYLCTVMLSKKAWPDLSAHRLNVVSDHLGITLRHHNAGSDAEACARIALAATSTMGVASLFDLEKAAGLTFGRLTPDGYTPCKGGPPPRRRPRPAPAPVAVGES